LLNWPWENFGSVGKGGGIIIQSVLTILNPIHIEFSQSDTAAGFRIKAYYVPRRWWWLLVDTKSPLFGKMKMLMPALYG